LPVDLDIEVRQAGHLSARKSVPRNRPEQGHRFFSLGPEQVHIVAEDLDRQPGT